MVKARPYYAQGAASARYYDLVASADRSISDDVTLYGNMTPEGGSILELGSGTGRGASALAGQGFRVLGVEIAPSMLAQAQAARDLAPEAVRDRLRYVQGDMTSLALVETFDVVLCPFYALAHVPRGAAWQNIFSGVVRHLRPGGLAAFHMPDVGKMSLPPPPPNQPVLQQTATDGSRLTLYVLEHAFRPGLDRMDITLDYVVTGPSGEKHSPERLTYYGGDPDPFALKVGLIVDRPPVPLGDQGQVHVYRRPSSGQV